MLANLVKMVNLVKWRFWQNFAKIVDKMIRANKLLLSVLVGLILLGQHAIRMRKINTLLFVPLG